jgi:hypothetical protein
VVLDGIFYFKNDETIKIHRYSFFASEKKKLNEHEELIEFDQSQTSNDFKTKDDNNMIVEFKRGNRLYVEVKFSLDYPEDSISSYFKNLEFFDENADENSFYLLFYNKQPWIDNSYLKDLIKNNDDKSKKSRLNRMIISYDKCAKVFDLATSKISSDAKIKELTNKLDLKDNLLKIEKESNEKLNKEVERIKREKDQESKMNEAELRKIKNENERLRKEAEKAKGRLKEETKTEIKEIINDKNLEIEMKENKDEESNDFILKQTGENSQNIVDIEKELLLKLANKRNILIS